MVVSRRCLPVGFPNSVVIHAVVSCWLLFVLCAPNSFAPSLVHALQPQTFSTSRTNSFLTRARPHQPLYALTLPDLEHAGIEMVTASVDVTTLMDEDNEGTSTDTAIIVPPQPPSSRWAVSGQVIALAAAAMYGTNFPCVKLLDQMLPSPLSAALRFSLAAVVVGGAVVLSETSPSTSSRTEDRIPSMLRGMEVGAWYSIGYISQAVALQHTAAGKCAFFNALAVVIVPLLEAVFNKTPPSLRSMGACLLAVAGVAILELGGTSTELVSTGDLMSAIMSLSFAVGYWRLGSATEAYPEQAARITLGQIMAVALGTIAYAMVALPNSWSEPYSWELLFHWLHDPFILGALAWTGLASTALALYMETMALRTITAADLTILMTSTSLWAAAFSYITLGEVMATTAMGGGLLILGGCLVSAQQPEVSNDVEAAKES